MFKCFSCFPYFILPFSAPWSTTKPVHKLIVTQRLVLFSQQESDRQQNTCVFLKRQNEQMQEDSDELNEQIQGLKVYE